MPATKEHSRVRRQRLKKRALETIGSRCVFCDTEDDINVAHVTPTGISGGSRGMDRRYMDVIKHPECYRPMCSTCHRTFDKLVKLYWRDFEPPDEEPVPF